MPRSPCALCYVKRVHKGSHGGLLFQFLLLLALSVSSAAADDWQAASLRGDYDQAVVQAVKQAKGRSESNPLATLAGVARERQLADTPMWRALLHYKPASGESYLSQVDADYFFMSQQGKSDPAAELDATLAAFFSPNAKSPMRLTAYCRFVARRFWLREQLGDLMDLLPAQPCEEFVRFETFLQAHVLTLIFPTAHPNSPSSAFGHTLIRIDKKDQSQAARLLNMSINFAAEVPADVAPAVYAINGLGGGFPGKYRLLPYHMKLREYAQVENRDTWEYPLKLSQQQVDTVLRHSYEMLISHYDYYFLSENCSYHLLSLLDVAFADEPLTDGFRFWTIPIDTIKLLRKRGLADEGQFIPSSISTLRTRQSMLPAGDASLALQALDNGLPAIESQLETMPDERQAGILDTLADYQRYRRLQEDTGAQSSSDVERQVLSRRSKLPVKTSDPPVAAPDAAPEQGHATSRVALRHEVSRFNSDLVELSFRPAYHDFRDPALAYGSNAAIDFGNFGIAQDLDADRAFLSRFTLISIESLEPRGRFFKPVSWHTRLGWRRKSADARHRFTFNVGAGGAWKQGRNQPLVFGFLESDLIDDTSFDQRVALRLGINGGVHWEPVPGLRIGAEYDYRRQVDDKYYESTAEVWASVAIGKRWSLVFDATLQKLPLVDVERSASVEIRLYF